MRETLHALVVGIDAYRYPIPRLDSCRNDAQTIGALLKNQPSFAARVDMLLDSDATLPNVTHAIQRLFSRGGGRKVLYFSGHGDTIPNGSVLEECLLCADGGKLVDNDLVQLANGTAASELTVILDCCFSAGLYKFVGGSYHPFGASTLRASAVLELFKSDAVHVSPDSEEDADPPLQAALFAACQEGELAASGTYYSRGLSAFTFALVSAIADRGLAITNEQLAKHTADILGRHGAHQTPVLRIPQGREALLQQTFLGFSDARADRPATPTPTYESH